MYSLTTFTSLIRDHVFEVTIIFPEDSELGITFKISTLEITSK